MSIIKAIIDGIGDRISNEPVLTMAVIQASILLAAGFGLKLTPEQITLLGVFSAAVLSWIARSKVTPV